MNSWIDTTSITFTRNTTYVRLDDVDPNTCVSHIPPTRNAEINAEPHNAGRSLLPGIAEITPPEPPARTSPGAARRGSRPRSAATPPARRAAATPEAAPVGRP